MYTKNVDMITEVRGAIADTQKSFLFLFPWIIQIKVWSHSQKKTKMSSCHFGACNVLSYNVLGNQKECQEGRSYQYCLPIPLQ